MIKYYWGTVGSGKSLRLLSSYLNDKRRHEDELTLVKPAFDTRTAGVYTRFGNVEVEADISLNKETKLTFIHALTNKKIFYIDEAQFIPVEYLELILKYRKPGMVFHIYGLRNDFNRNLWPSTCWLLNYADEIIEVPTLCEKCNEKASFNIKTSQTEEQVGFHYASVCWKCYG